MASCSCGTHTGHFACVCPAGYYGRGLVGDCTRKLLYAYHLFSATYLIYDYIYFVRNPTNELYVFR